MPRTSAAQTSFAFDDVSIQVERAAVSPISSRPPTAGDMDRPRLVRAVREDTTTLYTRILTGHVSADADTAALTIASGIIKIQMLDFLQQMTTFRVEGGPIANRITALARFGRLFLGKLWDVYGQQVLPFGPI